VITLGIDVGGTNTDIVLSGLATGAVVHKVPTTREDEAKAFVRGALEACAMAGIAPGEVDLVLHGTTVATNALLEHDGARTGLLTTAGYRDILHIGRHRRPDNFSLMLDIPQQLRPLVQRRFRKAVPERIIPPGVVATPLDRAATIRAIQELREDGVESICVCFLFCSWTPATSWRPAT
jgi:N-methylhydantoinase A